MASAPIYCTHAEFKRVFPQIDEFDQKTPIYNWTTESISGDTYYVAYDSGLMTQLFIDGKSQQSGNQTIATVKTDDAEEAIDATETAIDITLHSDWTANTFIKIDDEIMYVESATNDTQDTITVVRGVLGTTATTHDDGADIFLHFQPSANGDNLYDSDNDFIILKYGSDPNDNLTEAGEDFATMVTQFRTDASRYLDSRLDPKLPKNMWKNEAGEFDYMIIRTTALYAAAFMVKTKDPGSELATALMAEADNNVQLLNEGRAALSWQNTGDASKGVIRDVSYTENRMRPVDLRGRAGGVDYDLIKITIGTGGALGTATYNVWVKDSTGLKTNQVITAEVITGDYQPLAYGLQIRFGHDSLLDAVSGNEWEVEVRGYNEEVDTGDLKGIKMTRRRHYL
jgi:hypothetical protein